MPIKSVDKDDAGKIAGIFKSCEFTGVRSYLGKRMGQGWSESAADPEWAMIKNGDMYFLGGAPSAGDAEKLLSDKNILNDPENAVLIVLSERWKETLKRVFGNLLLTRSRFSVKAGKNGFDGKRLEHMAASLPKGYRLKPVDAELYYRCLSEPWSADFCSQFENEEDYASRGLGFVAIHEDKIVSGASSYFVYDGGIEIQVETRESYRRRGLALSCCAALMIKCLESGLYPSWDAANKMSLSLAEKLGYAFEKEYETYALKPGALKLINRAG